MDTDDIKNILVFMNRTSVQGTEVPAWVKAFNALNAEAARLAAPPPSPQ